MVDVSATMVLSHLRTEENHRLLIFAPWCYGHHPTYLQHLIQYWNRHQLPGALDILVSPEFLKEHSDVVDLSKGCDLGTVRFIPMSNQEYADLEANPSSFKRAVLQHRLIYKYAKQLKATQGLILYLDSCLLPLVMGAKLPCPFSGIYYRPTFHYHNFSTEKSSSKERLQQWKEQIFLFRVLRNPSLETLFSLDPLAVESIEGLGGSANVIHLPDPAPFAYSCDRPTDPLRQQLNIEPDRTVFLFFGRLSESRKGVPQLVEAISMLSSDLCQKICLLFAGEPEGAGTEQLDLWLTPIRDSGVQIVSCHGYIPESEVPNYFQLADVVLAPYQKHVGMSGILLLAASARKPLLSSNYGLMGEMVRRYGLGVAVDSTSPQEIAQGVSRFLLEDWDGLCDRAKMQAFAEDNSAEQFAKVIFQHV